MLLQASSVCGLFKWRQFEPEVILLAVSWLCQLICVSIHAHAPSVLRRNSHTDGGVSQGMNRNSSLTGHTNGVALIGPALLELIYPLASRKTLVLNALSKCSGKDS